ncbi:MAG: hypothetical protein Q4B51_02485 [Coriobacteriaceae bacterium]|nr:hypothetical protein [Coriobacteriaceae bacterium]
MRKKGNRMVPAKTPLSLALSFVLAFGIVPAVAFADDDTANGGIDATAENPEELEADISFGDVESGSAGEAPQQLPNEQEESQDIAVPVPLGKELVFNGEWQLGVDISEGWEFACADGEPGHFNSVTGCLRLDAGEYECALRLKDGYVWDDGSYDDAVVSWSIAPKAVAAPEAIAGLVENGEPQRGLAEGEGYELSGDCQALDAGDYRATATLLPNYVWEDGSNDPLVIDWSIAAVEKPADEAASETGETEAVLGNADEPSGEESLQTAAQEVIVRVPQGGSFEWGSDELEEWQSENVSYYYSAYGASYNGDGMTIAQEEDDWTFPVFGFGIMHYVAMGDHLITYTLPEGYRWEDGTTAPKKVTVTVTGGSVADCQVDLDINGSDIVYQGGIALRPPLKLSSRKLVGGFDWSYDLVLGKDYTVTYSNYTNAGTATATITGIGNFSGTVKKTYTIKQASLSQYGSATLSYTSCIYNGNYRKPVPTVKWGNKLLNEGKDYTVSYSNNKWTGTASVTIKGTGNYRGTITKTFRVFSANAGWVQVGSSWKYISNGQYASGWKTIGNNKYYFNTSTKARSTGLKSINGKRYYFNSKGVMQKSCWQKTGGSYYYLTSTGAAKSGWMTLGGKKYYLSTSSNKMLTGLNKISGKRYYFDSSGVMAKNAWKKVGSYWYYLGSTGQAKSGWMKSGGSWYYFDPGTNRMATGTKTIDGKRYRFSSSGVML